MLSRNETLKIFTHGVVESFMVSHCHISQDGLPYSRYRKVTEFSHWFISQAIYQPRFVVTVVRQLSLPVIAWNRGIDKWVNKTLSLIAVLASNVNQLVTFNIQLQAKQVCTATFSKTIDDFYLGAIILKTGFCSKLLNYSMGFMAFFMYQWG